MDMVSQIISKVNTLFDGCLLDKLAHDSSLIVRKRKIIAKDLLEKLIKFSLEKPNGSLDDLSLEFYKSDVSVSKQALSKKFNVHLIDFVQLVLKELLEITFKEKHISLSKLNGISNVKVVDSTEVRLHKKLEDIHPQVRKQGAAVKIQALMDALSNQMLSLEVRPSKEPDQGYQNYLDHIHEGDLFIGDLGYFNIKSFKELESKNSFYLSRYFKRANLYDMSVNENKIDLRELLANSQEDELEMRVAVGATKLPCRLVAIKLTEEAYEQRMKNIKEKCRKDPRSKDNTSDPLNEWTIFITNLSIEIEAFTLLEIYSLRWQIELLFKMMKSFLSLKHIESANEYRASVSIYISMIVTTLVGLITMVIKEKEISLYKASKVFITNIKQFFKFLHKKNTTNGENRCAILWIADIMSKFAKKESRKNRNSSQAKLGLSYA